MLIARIVLIVLTALFGLAMLVSYFMDVKKKAGPLTARRFRLSQR